MVLELFTIIIVEMAMQTYTDDKNIEFSFLDFTLFNKKIYTNPQPPHTTAWKPGS